MGRVHLFELNDQRWFPSFLRDGMTDYLAFMGRMVKVEKTVAPVVGEVLDRTGKDELLDLASGSTGPMVDVASQLVEDGREVRITLTDYYPNVEANARSRERGDHVEALDEPIDARDVPERFGGVRTLLNAFHHFRPSEARKILRDAFDKRRPIAIFEMAERTAPNLIGTLLIPILVLFVVPFLRPVRPLVLLFTYLIPILGLCIMWDGFVSHLRVYSVPELDALTADMQSQDWHWEARRLRVGTSPVYVTTLTGIPDDPQG